ncbi:MAG: 4Fe-4S ferredoxin [Lentisphaerae bacterium]|jgi:Fe-S-cluster-containing hydrogenase component 2|nr:4Fe-4S ferredoxin [Lentisphaerota bacterium]MBT4823243.1 4Fe-4S ferredoxin [Lentisphaerota bacterium]MBT5604803.1 4Fe-4S ferredoxin [Lentisphaerota bacterium]MBT7053554.1 4Fe-4S ferredoxin [Lentisphaerota bacterium]MBT7843391.1 4Fe-4S ferredoxin [Lentisphaerota bacterium]
MPDDRLKYMAEPGVPDLQKLQAEGLYPTDDRIAAGPVAVFECMQEIPCNPCEEACPRGCIRIGEDITGIPRLDPSCTGCGLCLPSCPGLCIFILDGSYSGTEATVTMPYELLPLPEEGETVDALDRQGREVCEGRVVRVRAIGTSELCRSLTVAIPKAFVHDVRHVRRQSD